MNFKLTNKLVLSSLDFKKCRAIRLYATKQIENKRKTSKKAEDDEIEIPVNPLKKHYSSNYQVNGEIYDRKPFKMICEEGKIYNWCLCGQSKNQPFCDGTHNNIFLKVKIKPIKFTVKKTKEYWLCNCKQTLNRPFCDGTHKTLLEKKNEKH
ncbi:PREDICTED: CDGSH iron-sulfur domain-containing protein 3, mitochondrial [Ceratosolen solmsi marchali]|uniref:CDGSH iron-sulfur domain-containing protein 3, mitochondrial n=1 Tax=Ceratosolen solmsi marchali TaxID=326594 RepID=A0AAJ6YEN5_9HYME|nr:PREDICTED: CDGSH iron-sulfur domain-containing protein 3, mitochondrial [Ceratosolen solmsi marchali]